MPGSAAFHEIGTRFNALQVARFGTDHWYAADTFIEMPPDSTDPAFLHNASKAVLAALTEVDPDAIWVMQGWPFHYNRDYWSDDRIESYLAGVPDDRLVVLDLWAEQHPCFELTNDYHGKSSVWSTVLNFGGRPGMHGDAQSLTAAPFAARDTYSCIGLGLAMEAFGDNPFATELFLAGAWSGRPVDPLAWRDQWLASRYAVVTPNITAAWNALLDTVYAAFDPSLTTMHRVVCQRPTLERLDALALVVPDELIPQLGHALDLLTTALGDRDDPALLRDCVDVGHQLLGQLAIQTASDLRDALNEQDLPSAEDRSARLLDILTLTDGLADLWPNYRLEDNLAEARRHGEDDAEQRRLEENLVRLITLWSTPGATLNDYSGRLWSGLVRGYHRRRWEIATEHWLGCLRKGLAPTDAHIPTLEAFELAFQQPSAPSLR